MIDPVKEEVTEILEEKTLIPERKIKIVRRPPLATWFSERIIAEFVPTSWGPIFDKTTEERKVIADLIKTKVLPFYREVYPLPENIYRAFELCPLDKVKVVIIGQDPYPQKEKGRPKAVGLSFSIAPDDPTIPGSLKNIFKEISSEYTDFKMPKHGDLRDWARQGVLLLNVALTFAPGQEEREGKGKNISLWKPFFVKTIKALNEYNPNIIYVLWGNVAQKATLPYVNSKKALVSGHPSSLNTTGNFFGNGHFKKINKMLEEDGQLTIDWQV